MRIFSIFLLFGCGLATADSFLIRSTDGGRTWTDIDPGPPYQLLASFHIDARTSALYALPQTDLHTDGHLLVSADRGQTWQIPQSLPPALFLNAPSAVSPDALYLVQEDRGNYPRSATITRIADSGQTVEQYRAEGLAILRGTASMSSGGYWTRLAAAPPARLYAIITHELADDLYAFFQALWVSADGGRNWRRLEPPLSPNCSYPDIWTDQSDSSVYLACGSSEFLKSTDGGESWTRKPTPEDQRIWNLQIGPGTPAILYASSVGIFRSGGLLWKSTDGADSWQRSGFLPGGVNSFQIHPANPLVIFGAGQTGAWRSDDGGETWTRLAGYFANYQLLADPRTPDTLYGYSLERQEARLNDRQTFLRNLVGEKQVAPGSLVSIYGRDLATQTLAASAPLPTSLAGASVSFNGQPAPLLFVSPDQINVQVPFGLAAETKGPPPTTSVIMEVQRPDGSRDRQTVSLFPKAVIVLRENLARQAAPLLFHGNDFQRVSEDAPARRGETITLFAVGMGDVVPPLAAGEMPPAPPPQLPNTPCVAFFERPNSPPLAAMPALWASSAPGLVGVYQVNFEIPASLRAGSYTLSLTDRRVGDALGSECRVGYQGDALDTVTIEVK
jgi:uncharacterized protein (TIGR03437 family)